MVKQNISYRGKPIKVDVNYPIRKGICEACGTKGFTSKHHWDYEFSIKEIRKNPLLALKNTTELCYTCHEVGNAIRKISKADKEIVQKLRELQISASCTNKSSSQV